MVEGSARYKLCDRSSQASGSVRVQSNLLRNRHPRRLMTLFGCADVASSSSVAASVAHSLSELEEYLEQPPAPNQTDVLSYWREQTKWQYLCVPATSAGVRRLFSRASLTYGDLRTCLSEENLSNILFAAYNYDPSLH